MPKYKLPFYQNRRYGLFLVVLGILLGCHNTKNENSAISMIRDLKKLPKEKLTEISFSADNLVFDIVDTVGNFSKKIFAINTGRTPLQVATVVASCNCTQVKFDKKTVFPNDSLGITLTIKNQGKPLQSAITIVGNVSDASKTVFIQLKR